MDASKLFYIISMVILYRVIYINTKSIKDIDDYLYLNIPHTMPSQYQYSMKVGFSPGQFGTEHNILIIPSENYEKTKFIQLYTNINDYHKFFNINNIRINDFHYKFYQHLINMNKLIVILNEKTKIYYDYLMPNLLNARIQFMLYYCIMRLNVMTNYSNYLNYTNTSVQTIQFNVQHDLHQYCPKACSYRKGIGFSSKHRNELNRYTELCNFPRNFMTISSQRCIEQKNTGLVNLQSFKCECSNGFIWKEQLKACYLPYGWRQKAEKFNKIVNIKRNDHFIYYAQNNCSRIGTKSIQPIEINSRHSDQPNYDKLYHTERCICKDEFYGTNCDQRKDPCKMRIGNVIMGDIACRTVDGNSCIPHKEFGTYTCQCITGYEKLINPSLLPRESILHNCLVHVNPCVMEPCIHGICVMSDSELLVNEKGKFIKTSFSMLQNKPNLTARCICDRGWEGKRCDFPVSGNIWSLWSNWSSCQPLCHSSFTRVPINRFPENKSISQWGTIQRSRYRDCLGKKSECLQEVMLTDGYQSIVTDNKRIWRHYEYQICRSRPSDQHLYLALNFQAAEKFLPLRQTGFLHQSKTTLVWAMLTIIIIFAIPTFAIKKLISKFYH